MKQSHSSLFSQSVGVPCDFRMSKRVPAILVAGRIQGREIVILDLFVADGLPHELGGLCPSSIEGISRIERGGVLQLFYEGTKVRIGFFLSNPFTLPLFDDRVPMSRKAWTRRLVLSRTS